ncbi:hypothetical protein EGW08_009225 [Elysia chlorotica]|uniref:Uncharacterized protein n=1 Tax=Elysia chlorotica TaxID=188477 RepID=A0A433TN77_ELYCH|nr:hypothetical protein EGW08_009225 [Elysia chlorotica]
MAKGLESLVYTLKELQSEKTCLEQKLQEQGLKKQSLEKNLEQESNKCAHVQEKHRRMAGTFAIAQQKVDATLTSCLSLQEEIEKIKPEMEKLQQSIAEEKQQQHKNILEFEAALSGIAAELFQARSFYKKSALQAEEANAEKAAFELERKAEKDEKEIQRMAQSLDSLSLEKDKSAAFGCENSLLACYSAMERDRQDAEKYRNRVKAELKEIQDVLNSEN